MPLQPNSVDCIAFETVSTGNILNGIVEIEKLSDIEKMRWIFLEVWKKRGLHYFWEVKNRSSH